MATLPFITAKPGVVFLLDVGNTPLNDDFDLLQISTFLMDYTRSRSEEHDDRSAARPHDRAYGNLSQRNRDWFFAGTSAAATNSRLST